MSLLFTFCTVACGQIGLGGGGLNDPTPSGTLVASGTFTSLNGKTVSGAVQVYNTDSSSYVIRLNGLSAPQESGLQMIAVINGVTQSATTLRANTGNQNYSVSAANNATFSLVRIFSPAANYDYAQATLQ